MIGTCSKCHQLYDFQSEEDAYAPDRLCLACYREEHGLPTPPGGHLAARLLRFLSFVL